MPQINQRAGPQGGITRIGNEDRVSRLLVTTIAGLSHGLIKNFIHIQNDKETRLTVPLISLIPDPAKLVDAIIGTLCNDNLARRSEKLQAMVSTPCFERFRKRQMICVR